jgi:outer membrane lipoprotein-sorting protein
VSQSEKLSRLEERIGLYYQEEANRIPIPQGLSQRIVEKAMSLAGEKPIRRPTFRLLARGGLAVAATATLLVAALVVWANVDLGTSTISAAEILQRVEQTYQSGQPSQDIPVAGLDKVLSLTGTELAEVLSALPEHYDATVVGEETMAGRDHYVLLLVPKGEDVLPQEQDALPPEAEIRLWVDKKSNLVTQIVVVEIVVVEKGPDIPMTVPEAQAPTGPEFGLSAQEGAAYASLLEDLGQRYDVTVISQETTGSTIHYVLSLVPKPVQEGPLPGSGGICDIWVDAESGKVSWFTLTSSDETPESGDGETQ